MNVAALAQSAMQNLMNNQIQTFQNNAQSNIQNGLNSQTSNSSNSFQSVLNNQLSSLQNNSLSQITAQNSLPDVSGIQATGQTDGLSMFKNIANSLISNVTQTGSSVQADIVKAAQGELDDPHQLLIDSEKANISLQMAISVRNKALDAYNDIIRMQV
jgi:flagellar hook-basal body complex protein FliE